MNRPDRRASAERRRIGTPVTGSEATGGGGMRAVVLGSGVIGTAAAYYLARGRPRGHRPRAARGAGARDELRQRGARRAGAQLRLGLARRSPHPREVAHRRRPDPAAPPPSRPAHVVMALAVPPPVHRRTGAGQHDEQASPVSILDRPPERARAGHRRLVRRPRARQPLRVPLRTELRGGGAAHPAPPRPGARARGAGPRRASPPASPPSGRSRRSSRGGSTHPPTRAATRGCSAATSRSTAASRSRWISGSG